MSRVEATINTKVVVTCRNRDFHSSTPRNRAFLTFKSNFRDFLLCGTMCDEEKWLEENESDLIN